MAINFEATITADNHYALFTGNTSSVTSVGHNELGYGGSLGSYNWSHAETYNFEVNAGDYIYVAGWSDDAVAQGMIGQFISDSQTSLSGTSDWAPM